MYCRCLNNAPSGWHDNAAEHGCAKEEIEDPCAVGDDYKREPCDTTGSPSDNRIAQYETLECGSVELEIMEEEKKFIPDSDCQSVSHEYKESGQVFSVSSTRCIAPDTTVKHLASKTGVKGADKPSAIVAR